MVAAVSGRDERLCRLASGVTAARPKYQSSSVLAYAYGHWDSSCSFSHLSVCPNDQDFPRMINAPHAGHAVP